MSHRHLQFPPDTPPEAVPSAAIVEILQRGDLADWRPIAVAVARDPFGEFAERVARLADAYPAYGSSPLWRAWIERCRVRAGGGLAPRGAASLAGLRRRAGLTQVEMARRLGISQSDVSKLERRADVRVSTLRAYVAALGDRLRIVCGTKDGPVEVRLPRGRR